MDQASPPFLSQFSLRMRAAAFSVHILTALGAGLALMAMLEAVREHWTRMFFWLGVALVVDAVDGPLARRLDVVRLQPNWSGEVLDLVVDFLTYVFVPAYAITAASGMLLPLAAPILGIGIVVIVIRIVVIAMSRMTESEEIASMATNAESIASVKSKTMKDHRSNGRMDCGVGIDTDMAKSRRGVWSYGERCHGIHRLTTWNGSIQV